MTEEIEFTLQISQSIPTISKDFRSGCYFIKEGEGERDYPCLYFTLPPPPHLFCMGIYFIIFVVLPLAKCFLRSHFILHTTVFFL